MAYELWREVLALESAREALDLTIARLKERYTDEDAELYEVALRAKIKKPIWAEAKANMVDALRKAKGG